MSTETPAQTSDYTGRITSEHADKPNFTAMVSAMVAPSVQIQTLLYQVYTTLFDLATPPVGNALDIIGQIVGISRNVQIPIVSGFFEWDDTDADGWDYGVWSGPTNDVYVIALPDNIYLTLIQAKIAANHWDGTTEGAYAIWAVLFPNLSILVQDNEDMTFILGIQGFLLDALTQALFIEGYLPLRPEGVQITEFIFPADTNPLFGWDTSNDFIGGWGTGSWGSEFYAS